jgi:hypothetical protein
MATSKSVDITVTHGGSRGPVAFPVRPAFILVLFRIKPAGSRGVLIWRRQWRVLNSRTG